MLKRTRPVSKAPSFALSSRASASAALLLASLAFVSCGKSGIVAVRRPLETIRVCDNLSDSEWGCRHEFDAGSLVGMSLPDAARLAEAHGYVVRRVAPLQKREVLTTDFRKDRIDVETDSSNERGTVVRFVEKG
jgi:hypothetical protein